MRKELILKKVIQKAEKNGWSRNKHSNKLLARGIPYGKIGFESVIFDHSFAKAFFGYTDETTYGKPYGEKELWEYHLQQLALAKDRLKYLSKFVK